MKNLKMTRADFLKSLAGGLAGMLFANLKIKWPASGTRRPLKTARHYSCGEHLAG